MENTKTIRRRRSDCSWKKESKVKIESETSQYTNGPIKIACSWNPIDRTEKPPYSYATIIGHAILTSKDRKLTLNDIYVWITENYPFYSNDTQGWQNSIRHNLSLHKSFVKLDRDPNVQNPPRKGCFWTIRQGREKFFIDNLQKPVNSVKRQQSLSHLARSSKRQHFLRRTSSNNLPLSSASTVLTSPSRLFSSFRATNDVPESEQHLQSSSSPSSSSSPTSYHQLFYNVPEPAMSYIVYPSEQTDFFENDYYLNSKSNSHPPSLSPCDAYSTTSSYNNDYQSLTSSNRSSYSGAAGDATATPSSLYPHACPTPEHHYSSFASQNQQDSFAMEWSAIPNTIPQENSFSAAYYLQHQLASRCNSMNFDLCHR
ncbi:hypothetical protein [Parasitella parasitica]|uniref:Fork-head domain-containing protein n=1 Tax=Parasitella parasitica TaxID=35722 RepID=A0A0B7NVR2_9FUNG|nr:hypothetical protein [Parasitella parasitica]